MLSLRHEERKSGMSLVWMVVVSSSGRCSPFVLFTVQLPRPRRRVTRRECEQVELHIPKEGSCTIRH